MLNFVKDFFCIFLFKHISDTDNAIKKMSSLVYCSVRNAVILFTIHCRSSQSDLDSILWEISLLPSTTYREPVRGAEISKCVVVLVHPRNQRYGEI